MDIKTYVMDFEEEAICAFELEGKAELRAYAKYWLKDIYEYSHSKIKGLEVCSSCIHMYNKNGYVEVEEIADEIYEQLKNFKLFLYYYEGSHKNMRGLINEMKSSPVSFLSEEERTYKEEIENNSSLYDIDDVLPLPLSSHNLFSYVNESFTPDMTELTGLKNAMNEMKKVLPIDYLNVCKGNYILKVNEILNKFEIPLDKIISIETSLVDGKVIGVYRLHLNGIENRRPIKKMVYLNINEIEYSIVDLLDKLKAFIQNCILYVIGKQKKKNGNEDAIYGIYPVKDMDFHGLKLEIPSYLNEKKLLMYEKQSMNIIKESLLLPGEAIVSSSYGVDSVLVQVLVSKVYPNISVYHGKTGLNFKEVYDVEKELIDRGITNEDSIYYGKYKKSFWSLVDEFGFNFERKGDRRTNSVGRKVSVSEMCCSLIKHKPFLEAIEENNWNINFAGLRADESRVRELAAKRDGPLYHAASWNLFRINPIIFWTDSDVWGYTKEHDIPYCSIYDMVLYDSDGKASYFPRIGCWSCMLTAKYGYLKWLKKFKPKMYKFLMLDKGLLKLLYAKKFGCDIEVNKNGKEHVEHIEDFDVEQVYDFLEHRPCFFDDTVAKL